MLGWTMYLYVHFSDKKGKFNSKLRKNSLTHLSPMLYFYTRWKHAIVTVMGNH